MRRKTDALYALLLVLKLPAIYVSIPFWHRIGVI